MTESLLRSNYPDVPYLTTALRLAQLSAVIELLSEPAFVTVQQNMLYKTRAAAEATAVIVKTLVTAGLVFWAQGQGQELGVLPFAAGELAYSTSLTIVYLTQTVPVARLEGFSLLPKRMQTRCVSIRSQGKCMALILFFSVRDSMLSLYSLSLCYTYLHHCIYKQPSSGH